MKRGVSSRRREKHHGGGNEKMIFQRQASAMAAAISPAAEEAAAAKTLATYRNISANSIMKISTNMSPASAASASISRQTAISLAAGMAAATKNRERIAA
jgi:hypothetical protein